MRVFGWELRKLISSPAVWAFLIACILINGLLVFSSSYDSGYVRYVSRAAADFGTRVDDDFVEQLKKLPKTEERERLLAFAEQMLTAEKNGAFEVDTSAYAEDYIRQFGLNGIWATLFSQKYEQLQPAADRTAENGAADLYAADMTESVHRGLFETLLHAVLCESIVFAFLVVLMAQGYEPLHRTDSLVFVTRTGRRVAFPKLGAAVLCGLFCYFLLVGTSMFFYSFVWDLSGFWNADISGGLHSSPDYSVARPFFTWAQMTVGGYFWAQFMLGIALILVFCLLAVVLGLFMRNAYAAFAVAVAASLLFLLLPGWFRECGLFGAAFGFSLSPVWAWNTQSLWFTDMGFHSLWPWWETTAVFLSGVLSFVLMWFAYRRYRRKDVI